MDGGIPWNVSFFHIFLKFPNLYYEAVFFILLYIFFYKQHVLCCPHAYPKAFVMS